MDLNDVQRPINDAGQRLADLDYLNLLLQSYVEGRSSAAYMPKGPFKSEAEEMAAIEKAERQKSQPVTDLNELVRAKFIKAIPQAPAGKKYAIDPKTGKVVLADQ